MKHKRPKAAPTPLATQKEMVALYRDGWTPTQLAEKYGLAVSSTRAVLQRYLAKYGGIQEVRALTTGLDTCPLQAAFENYVRELRAA